MTLPRMTLADTETLAAQFLADRTARHGNLRMEATGDGDGTDDGADGQDGADDQDGADALADKGKQALDRMKGQRNQFRDELRPWQALGVTPDQVRELLAKQSGGNDAPDADAIRREAEQAATAKVNQRILRTEIKAAAAGKLADPADAHQFLDLDQFEVDADGNVDESEIAEAIDDLLKSKPYLAAQGRRFQGGADGGARKETAKPEPAPGLGRLRAAYADSK